MMRLLKGSRPDWPALARRFHSRARSPLCVPRFHHCRASCPCTLLPLCGASDSIREEGCERERRQDCGIGRHPRDDLSATPGARGRHLCSCVSQSQRFRRSVVNRHQPAHNPFHHHQQPTGRPQTQARTKPVLPPIPPSPLALPPPLHPLSTCGGAG